MNPIPLLNHLSEASVALAVFYAVYRLLLHREPGYRFNRVFILAAVPLAGVLPWLQWPAARALPAALVLALPEMAAVSGARPEEAGFDLEWQHLLALLYAAGAAVAALRLAGQLARVWRWRRRLPAVRHPGYWLVRTGGLLPTFSFLDWLFWDDAQPLTETEKALMLAHEQAHIRQRHSADVLGLELGKIVFWFHPAVYAFGRAQRAVHEYLADQAALRHGPPGAYLQLLARSLLHNLNLPLVQSFHPSSLQIRMKRIRESESAAPAVWKMVAGMMTVLLVVLVFACSHGSILPPDRVNVSGRVLNAAGEPLPGAIIIVKGTNTGTTSDTDGRYTLVDVPAGSKLSISLEKTVAAEIPVVGHQEDVRLPVTGDGRIVPPPPPAPPLPPAPPDDVFVVVEEMPRFPGGIPGLGKYLSDNIRYPTEAREGNIQGKVFVQFVVREDGRITDVEVARSPDSSLSAEAARVVGAMPRWRAGRQSGRAVPVRYSLPIDFAL